jgi:hypothetical protein
MRVPTAVVGDRVGTPGGAAIAGVTGATKEVAPCDDRALIVRSEVRGRSNEL